MRLEYFQMVDRVVEMSCDDGIIRVESVVPMASTVFEGHFPGYPLVPGVLLIETMAQTAGWIILARNRFDRMPFLAGVRSAKLRRFVTPGERLSVEGRIIHEGSAFCRSPIATSGPNWKRRPRVSSSR